MKVIAFLTDYAVVDRVISHFKLTFVAERSVGFPAFVSLTATSWPAFRRFSST
jgi:hypothetical protein